MLTWIIEAFVDLNEKPNASRINNVLLSRNEKRLADALLVYFAEKRGLNV